jgi:hypothetical protein
LALCRREAHGTRGDPDLVHGDGAGDAEAVGQLVAKAGEEPIVRRLRELGRIVGRSGRCEAFVNEFDERAPSLGKAREPARHARSGIAYPPDSPGARRDHRCR